MGRFFIFILCMLLNTETWAAVYGPLVIERSSIRFVSKQMGVSVEGGFRRFTGQLNFDPVHPEAARARIDVELASVDAGSTEANDEVVGKDWFFVRQFPTARFDIRHVKALGNGQFEVQGALTIKNVTQDMVTKASFHQEAGLGIFAGGFTLKRLAFGIGEGAWGDPSTVADEVKVNFVLAAKPSIAKSNP
ncbi:MAG: YceI family protein [Rugosibacter sp.]|nr:MAG: YceI family protein [Rugosibacter sp.]